MDPNAGILTNEQLTELDAEIDALIPSFELLKTTRRLALRTVLTEFDALVQQYALEQDLAQRMMAYRGAYQALDHAIRWIFVHCPENSEFVPNNPEASALELLGLARDYHYVFTQMSLAFRGRNNISRDSGNRFRVTSASTEDRRLETARSLLAAAQFPESHEETTDMPGEIADEVRKAITIDGLSVRQLIYSFSEETFSTVATTMEARRLYDRIMNPEWDLGGYTFGDLQVVWTVLKTLQSIHQLALQKLPRQQDRRRLNLKIRTRAEWVDEISKYSLLDAGVVNRVFADLIYDPRLHGEGRKRAHVMYQPFFELGTDEIVQSNALVMMSAVEKCSWILTELLRSEIHDKLKTRKERYWIDEEFKAYETDRIKIFPHLKFTHQGKPGDVDLLIVDLSEKFALVAQLKWTTAMDNVAGVESDDKQYSKGVDQAVRSVEWAENNRDELAQRLGIDVSTMRSMTFRPIVIAKETLPSGSFSNRQVPVINEALFRWIMEEPHNATLAELWNVASTGEYLPIEGLHFERHDPAPLVWGDIEFTLEDVAYVPLPRRWDPATDIVILRPDRQDPL